MATATLESQGEVDQYLDSLVQAAANGDFSDALRRWSQEAHGLLGQYMTQGKSPDGTPYQPLKNPRPTGHNQQSGPLIDFGDLLLSLIGEGSGGITRVDGRSAEVGTEHTKDGAAIASIQNYGTRDGKIPARPFVQFNEELVALARARVAEGLALAIGNL